MTPATTKASFEISTEQLEALGRPTLEAENLPPECYSDPGAYEKELENIFFKEWICVGRVEDIPNVGDYMTTNIATEPLIIVRDGEGQIRAHFNVCRHRACQLVQGEGTTNSFRCPYHGWMFALNGELRGTPDFKETKNFSKKDYPLFSAQVEIWQGFIMINMSGDAAPFKDQVNEIDRWSGDKYRMDEMVTTNRWEYHLDCNWKTYVENYIEEYHIPWVHPETFQLITPMKNWIEFDEISDQPWSIMIGQTPGLTFSDTGDALFSVSPELNDLPPEFDGMPIWLAYPTMMVIPTVDALIYYVAFPEGPEKCRVMLRLALHNDSVAAIEAGDEEATAGLGQYARNTEMFIAEDNAICSQQQVGLRSRRGTAGRYCKHEGFVRAFDKWVADKAYSASPSANGSGNGARG